MSRRDLENEIEEVRKEEERRPADYRRIRENITKRIEELIVELNPSLDRQKAAILARHLDAKLYASSSGDFALYSDPHSLDERLRSLARGMGLQIVARRQQQQNRSARQMSTEEPSNGSSSSYADERKWMLRRRVGDETYEEIVRLVSEVEEIRRTNGAWTWIAKRTAQAAAREAAERSRRAAAAAAAAASDDGAEHGDEEGSSSEEEEEEEDDARDGESSHRTPARQASTSMPAGLTGVYFGPRLVEAYRALVATTSSLQPERVDRVSWEDLVSEARDNIAAFREMENEALAMQTCGLKRATCAFAW